MIAAAAATAGPATPGSVAASPVAASPLAPGLLGHPLPRRVAVLRALTGLGDLLCLVPALRALRAGLPDARLTLVGLPEAAPVVERFPHYVDELVVLPGWPGLPEHEADLAKLVPFLASMQERSFDLALQLHGSGVVSNPLAALLGARHTAGFNLAGQFCPDPRRFLPYLDHEPEVRRALRLVEHLGLPASDESLEFPLGPDDELALSAVEETAGLAPGSYACVHPGANVAPRRWPTERFAAVADGLARRGLAIVLTGTAGEASLTAAVARAMDTPAIDLAGRTPLGALAALVSKSRLLVANDTGVSHLAGALRTPSVVVFSASDPQRWAPLDQDRHRVIGPHPAASVDAVVAEVDHLLAVAR